MGAVRIYQIAALLGTTTQEVVALFKRDHGIAVESASDTIEEMTARQFVERIARQRDLSLPQEPLLVHGTMSPALPPIRPKSVSESLAPTRIDPGDLNNAVRLHYEASKFPFLRRLAFSDAWNFYDNCISALSERAPGLDVQVWRAATAGIDRSAVDRTRKAAVHEMEPPTREELELFLIPLIQFCIDANLCSSDTPLLKLPLEMETLHPDPSELTVPAPSSLPNIPLHLQYLLNAFGLCAHRRRAPDALRLVLRARGTSRRR